MTTELKEKISQKLRSARKFDKKHGHICASINVREVLQLLILQDEKCFFCDCDMLLYDYSRHPDSFTCDRLNNSIGHCRENIVMSCFHCNVSKKSDNYNFNIIRCDEKRETLKEYNRRADAIRCTLEYFLSGKPRNLEYKRYESDPNGPLCNL
jgi:hypothetical protein